MCVMRYPHAFTVIRVIQRNFLWYLLQHSYLYKEENKPLDSIHILYNLAASEKLTGEIGMERLPKSKTLTCIKAGLLKENESGHFQFVL